MTKRVRLTDIILNLIFIIISLACVFPLLLVLGISFTTESGVLNNGYTLIPSEFTLEAYKYIGMAGDTIFRAYGVTIFNSIIGSSISVFVVALFAYPLSRKDFKYRKFFTFYVFFTMLFSGGLVSWYMICTSVLKLNNTVWAMILPYVMNAWHVIIMRTFFSTTIPDALIESAKIDGAGEFRTFFQIVMPLSLPGLATVGLFTVLQYWNDWWLPLMFVTQVNLRNLQFLLQSMIKNIQMLTENTGVISNSTEQLANIPKESVRMALCVIAIGPIIAAYPFFQKYFVQGLTVGAIKG